MIYNSLFTHISPLMVENCIVSNLNTLLGLLNLKYEGAVNEGSRGDSIWDTLISKPGF